MQPHFISLQAAYVFPICLAIVIIGYVHNRICLHGGLFSHTLPNRVKGTTYDVFGIRFSVCPMTLDVSYLTEHALSGSGTWPLAVNS